MNVFVNDQNQFINPDSTISELLEIIKASPQGIAVAVNNMVVPRNYWDKHNLKENDKVLIIKATQGG